MLSLKPFSLSSGDSSIHNLSNRYNQRRKRDLFLNDCYVIIWNLKSGVHSFLFDERDLKQQEIVI